LKSPKSIGGRTAGRVFETPALVIQESLTISSDASK